MGVSPECLKLCTKPNRAHKGEKDIYPSEMFMQTSTDKNICDCKACNPHCEIATESKPFDIISLLRQNSFEKARRAPSLMETAYGGRRKATTRPSTAFRRDRRDRLGIVSGGVHGCVDLITDSPSWSSDKLITQEGQREENALQACGKSRVGDGDKKNNAPTLRMVIRAMQTKTERPSTAPAHKRSQKNSKTTAKPAFKCGAASVKKSNHCNRLSISKGSNRSAKTLRALQTPSSSFPVYPGWMQVTPDNPTSLNENSTLETGIKHERSVSNKKKQTTSSSLKRNQDVECLLAKRLGEVSLMQRTQSYRSLPEHKTMIIGENDESLMKEKSSLRRRRRSSSLRSKKERGKCRRKKKMCRQKSAPTTLLRGVYDEFLFEKYPF